MATGTAVLPTDVRLVNFDRAGQWVAVRWCHREANAMEHEQATFVAQSGLAMDLKGRDALLARRRAPETEAPVAHRNPRVLEHGSRANAELRLAASAAPTVVLLASATFACHLVDVHIATVRAASVLAPTVRLHELDCLKLVSARGWQVTDWLVALGRDVLYFAHGFFILDAMLFVKSNIVA